MPQVLISGRRSLYKSCTSGNLAGVAGIVAIIVGNSKTVMSRSEGPIPILLPVSRSGVEFYQFITVKPRHYSAGTARSTVRMVQNLKIRLSVKHIQLPLALGSQKRQKMIIMPYLFRSENQFMILQKIEAVLIYIHLQSAVSRMLGEFVMVTESQNIIVKLAIVLKYIFRP